MPEEEKKKESTPITRYIRMRYNQYSRKAIAKGETPMTLQEFADKQGK